MVLVLKDEYSIFASLCALTYDMGNTFLYIMLYLQLIAYNGHTGSDANHIINQIHTKPCTGCMPFSLEVPVPLLVCIVFCKTYIRTLVPYSSLFIVHLLTLQH